MSRIIESSVSDFIDYAYGQLKEGRNGLLSNEEINQLFLVLDPCLVIVKPHAVSNERLVGTVMTLISNLGLQILTQKRVEFTRKQVFRIYGDLFEVMAQGPEGVTFVKGLADSFVEGNEGIAIIVYGQESYLKMKKVKKMVRQMGVEDRFRNILHTSDDLASTMREVTALLIEE